MEYPHYGVEPMLGNRKDKRHTVSGEEVYSVCPIEVITADLIVK